MSKPPQVVVTGAGLVTCLGLTAAETWAGVLAKRRGLTSMAALEQPIPDGHTGGQAVELPENYLHGLPREVRYLRWAVEDAWRQSSLVRSGVRPERVGVILGTTLHGIRQGGQYLRTGDHNPLEHFLAGSIVEDVLAGLPVNGPAVTTCSACSSGLASIAMGMTLLRAGVLDVVIAGGYDPVSEYVYAGFNSLRLVASNDLMPFTKGRDGMKLAEGYSVVVLERAADAMDRGADALAVLLGWGESSDAHHLTQPQPEGEGAARAARAAIAMAGIEPRAIGLCSAHATATPNNDAAEFAAMKSVLGDRLEQTPVVAFKSHVGHTLGAAGATELILSIMAMKEQIAPPTANVRMETLEFPVRVNCDGPRDADISATMNMSLGFGGANTCMVAGRGSGRRGGERDTSSLRSARSRDAQERAYLRPVLVTGVGVVAPGIIGNAALAARLRAASPAPISADAGGLSDEALAALLNARRVRRMSEYEKITLAATAEAFSDANIEEPAVFGAECGAVLGSMLGSTSFSEAYYRQIVKEGIGAANPMLFAEGVPNAAAAQLSMVFGIKSGCQTVIGSRTSGLEALWLASMRIATGEWERAIVSAAEEHHGLANEIWRQWGYKAGPGFVGSAKAPRGFFTGSGAATLILESEASAADRGVVGKGMIDARASGAACGRGVASLVAECEGLIERVGQVDGLVLSSNGTWLDRVELAALRRANFRGMLGSIEGHVPELLSAGPLAAIAGVLMTERLPERLFGGAAGLERPARSAGFLVTDFAGLAAAVRVSIGTSQR